MSIESQQTLSNKCYPKVLALAFLCLGLGGLAKAYLIFGFQPSPRVAFHITLWSLAIAGLPLANLVEGRAASWLKNAGSAARTATLQRSAYAT
jgi:hypothetical protein